MKAAFYILGPMAFGALILINQPLPEEPSPAFKEMRNEMFVKEDLLNKKISQVENQFHETKILIQEEMCEDIKKK